MKLILSLFVIISSISLLLIHTNSFSTAEIRNEAELSIVSEEKALIAISYQKSNMITLTNNTGNTLEIESIEILNHFAEKINLAEEMDTFPILPGGVKDITITGDLKDAAWEMVQIKVRWNGGRAEIKSTIPEQMSEL
ncbi:hypothetical protein [Neobacillus sp. FSL H8-0543]|uniref:hypothetical protein n=1 Tax=Neobacillus sp. FSL H8-0543 TaxID=2954672 RepID=UPI003158DDDD